MNEDPATERLARTTHGLDVDEQERQETPNALRARLDRRRVAAQRAARPREVSPGHSLHDSPLVMMTRIAHPTVAIMANQNRKRAKPSPESSRRNPPPRDGTHEQGKIDLLMHRGHLTGAP